jgi:hypothetical protein
VEGYTRKCHDKTQYNTQYFMRKKKEFCCIVFRSLDKF